MKKLLPLLLLTMLTPSCIFVIVDRVDEEQAEALEETATIYPVDQELPYGPQQMDDGLVVYGLPMQEQSGRAPHIPTR